MVKIYVVYAIDYEKDVVCMKLFTSELEALKYFIKLERSYFRSILEEHTLDESTSIP